MAFIIILVFLIYLIFAWKKFDWAVLGLIIILPTYLLRYSFGGNLPVIIEVPVTILEICFGAVLAVWLIRYAKKDWSLLKKKILKHKIFFAFLFLFLFSAGISIFVSDMPFHSFGHFKAYFLEPIILFFILLSRSENLGTKKIVWALVLSSLSVSLYAVFQKFTGMGIATPQWSAVATRRVTAFFTSPNAVGLYLAPILILSLGLFKEILRLHSASLHSAQDDGVKMSYTKNKDVIPTVSLFFSLSLIILAILFTKSEGTVIGLGAAAVSFIYLIGFKKTAILTVLLGLVFSLSVPKIRTAVLFQDQAGQNRFTLWSYSYEYMTESPYNFVFGTGLRQFFRKIQKPYYDDAKMERLIYPHNIFLNFWTETGLLGLVSFVGLSAYLFWLSLKIRRKDLWRGAVLFSVLIYFFVHGLVDVPYFKNDLAMMFWVIASLYFL